MANEDHLSYFKFIGRVVGMAVYHGKLVDGECAICKSWSDIVHIFFFFCSHIWFRETGILNKKLVEWVLAISLYKALFEILPL